MKKLAVLLVLLAMVGCSKKEPDVWARIKAGTVTSIEFIGVGGYGSPDAMRVWRLDTGEAISMYHWKRQEVAVGDKLVCFRNEKGVFYWKKENEVEIVLSQTETCDTFIILNAISSGPNALKVVECIMCPDAKDGEIVICGHSEKERSGILLNG